MSAWIVPKTHIDTLVTALLAYELAVREQATAVGRKLWQENLHSIHARYPDTVGGSDYPGPIDFTADQVAAYQFELVPGRVDPTVVNIAARCFDYQSCEHAGWYSSRARRWVTDLSEVSEGQLEAYARRWGPVLEGSGFPYESHAYSWGIEHRDVFEAAAAIRAAAQVGMSA